MSKSKPPRRRYRPLHRIDKIDERMMTFYDKLEEASARQQQLSAPFPDRIPAKERAYGLAKHAEIRAEIAQSRSEVLPLSPTPVLDDFLRQDAKRRRESVRRD